MCREGERGKDTTGFAKNTSTETREKQFPLRDKVQAFKGRNVLFRHHCGQDGGGIAWVLAVSEILGLNSAIFRTRSFPLAGSVSSR